MKLVTNAQRERNRRTYTEPNAKVIMTEAIHEYLLKEYGIRSRRDKIRRYVESVFDFDTPEVKTI